MGKFHHSLLIISVILTGTLCHSQTTVQISDPRLELKDNMVHIHYDIQNSDPSEKYFISVVITDEDGNPFDADALDGDVGMVEVGGRNKQITWNLEADNIYINANVFVKINARVIPPPEDTPEDTPEETPEETPEKALEVKEDAPVSGSSTFNRTGIVLQSLAIPGLGLSRVTGNPHWIRGMAGYGCIIGSVILNRQAIQTFDSIDDMEDPAAAETAFNKSVRQDKISEGLAYAAIGIWVTDIIWTWIGTLDLRSDPLIGDLKNISIHTHIDPLSYAPLVCFRYTF
ncbi:MAG: hypothetical protein K8R52_05345 [Bacteroidales bacterium]|nr:hypothetical protein [Bacteroidales bacterium]